MYEYVAITTHPLGEMGEVRILTAEFYKQIIAQDPGFRHDNHGTFFSEMSVDRLADELYRIANEGGEPPEKLWKKHHSPWFRVVDAGEFDKEAANREYTNVLKEYNDEIDDVEFTQAYLIREENGVGFYDPVDYDWPGAQDPPMFYGFLLSRYIEKIFSEKEKGSVQLLLDFLNDSDN